MRFDEVRPSLEEPPKPIPAAWRIAAKIGCWFLLIALLIHLYAELR